jgi:succinoglycan biosynthesis protein ExoA
MKPNVSVLIPCYNEQVTIPLVLQAIAGQTYPLNRIEIIVSDGMSTDRIREEITAFQLSNPNLTLTIVDNFKKNIPSALNVALAHAKGSIIIRMDGHSIPNPEYIERSVADLESGLGENVGGVWDIRPASSGWISRSIALAATHRLGVGDAQYRYTDQSGYVDTVPFGAFKKELVDRIGPFDETLLTNEDYEFNVRIRQSGGRIWLDPAIRSIYYARESLQGLAKQYRRYGYWKAQMLKRYPSTIRIRQAIPPLFFISLLSLLILSIWFNLAGLAFLLEVVVYLAALWIAAAQLSVRHKDVRLLAGVPLAMATIHFSWAGGFLWSMIVH